MCYTAAKKMPIRARSLADARPIVPDPRADEREPVLPQRRAGPRLLLRACAEKCVFAPIISLYAAGTERRAAAAALARVLSAMCTMYFALVFEEVEVRFEIHGERMK